ncbi:MAG: cytochrome C [Gemmatimonadota bacterium]|nr:cytochrome C [Gemmatimonadota bacterium]
MPGFRQLSSAHAPLAGTVACIIALAVLFGAPRVPLENAAAGVTGTSVTANRAAGSMANLGKLIFHDRALSLNKNQSCASCHEATFGFAAPNDLDARGGVMPGSNRDRFGTRKPPSAAYATHSPVLHYDETDSVWVGGGFWDGRATGRRLRSPAAEQALEPFVNPVEQALPDVACVVYRVAHGRYSSLAVSVLGPDVERIRFPSNTDALCSQEGAVIPVSATDRLRIMDVYDLIGLAIADFEDSPAMNQFSSKYDAYVEGRVALTEEELRGLELYENKAKCAACHPNEGTRALFTDFTYDNIGVPPNPRNPARRADPEFGDPGLGAVIGDESLRGAHKVPTLRNVDRRRTPSAPKAYMHNGAFTTLEEVVHFYNTRDVLANCERVAHPDIGVNCWPAPEVPQNVNTEELGDLKLTASEERALVAYLRTLSDGYIEVVAGR